MRPGVTLPCALRTGATGLTLDITSLPEISSVDPMLIAGNNASPGSSGNVLALVADASLEELNGELNRLGYKATATDDPYAALMELLDRPLVYRALVISLPALYREELALIRTVRAKLPHVDVLLAHTDGRHAALAEAMRLGATALLSDEAVHRLADVKPPPEEEAEISKTASTPPATETNSMDGDFDDGPTELEPLLTADELRALLQEQPTLPGAE